MLSCAINLAISFQDICSFWSIWNEILLVISIFNFSIFLTPLTNSLMASAIVNELPFNFLFYFIFVKFALHTRQFTCFGSWSIWTYKWSMNVLFDSKTKNRSLTWWITLFLGFQDNLIIIHLHNMDFIFGRMFTLVNCI